MNLIFATHNNHKCNEVKQMLPNFNILNLTDIGFHNEIIEDGDSFKANAEIKVNAILNKHKENIFADDSGLVIPALNGEPGIFSARYAGTGESSDNIQKVLTNLKGVEDRYAYFIAVICLVLEDKKYFFEGKTEGVISKTIHGEGGFGYDPIFIPKGYNQSFAEISSEEKNRISHRGKAIKNMYDFMLKITQ